MYVIVFVGLCALVGTSIYLGAVVIPNMVSTKVSNQTAMSSYHIATPIKKSTSLSVPFLPIEIVSEAKMLQLIPVHKRMATWSHKKGKG